MNVRAFLGALALGLSALAAPALAQPAPAEAAQHQVPVVNVVSPGGIEAWLVSDSTVPIITLRAYFQGGVADDAPELTGATGIMADMLTEGAGDYDANAFKERLEDLHGSVGLGGGWDGVSLSITTLTENRDAIFELARLALTAPRFDAAPLERIKRQSAIGIRQRQSNPGYLGNLAMDQALLGDHVYARRTSLETLSRINADVLRASWRRHITRAHLMITVVGDISADDLGKLLDSTFGALPAGEVIPEAPQAELRAATPLIVRELPQPQSLILFNAPGIQDEDPDWVALSVANYIIGGGGFSSRLMDEVREKGGLVYGIGTGPSVLDGAAFIRGSAQTENGKVAQAIDKIRSELKRFYEQGATQAELDDAVAYLTGSFALSLDSDQGIADVVHGYHSAGRDIDYINGRDARFRAVTLADVNRVAHRLFNPDAFTFVVVGQPDGLSASDSSAH